MTDRQRAASDRAAGRPGDVLDLGESGTQNRQALGTLGDLPRRSQFRAPDERLRYARGHCTSDPDARTGTSSSATTTRATTTASASSTGSPSTPPFETPPFYSGFLSENPDMWHTTRQGIPSIFKVAFSPWGIQAITPFTHEEDLPAPEGTGGERVGKSPTPRPLPTMTCSWSGRRARPTTARPHILPYYDGGIYLQPAAAQIWDPADLVLVKNDPATTTRPGRAPWCRTRASTASPSPSEIPWLPNDGTLHAELPAGTPHGLIGSSSCTSARASPAGWIPTRNASTASTPSTPTTSDRAANWFTQGGDAGKYADSEIWALRILAMEPNSDRSLRAEQRPPVRQFRAASGCASSARSRCASSDGRRRSRSRGQSRTPASWPRSRRHAVHLSDARPQRHGAQHGPDLAPGAARRECAPTAAAATPTARLRSTSSSPRRRSRATRSATCRSKRRW